MEFITQRGTVSVVSTSTNHHGVFLKQGSEFIGSVVEEYEGTHVAHPADHRDAKRHSTLRAAVLWIGEKV